MRVFVTGGTGFIGSHLLHILQKNGHRVLALSRTLKNSSNIKASNLVEFLVGDLGNVDQIEKAVFSFHPETLVHLAWEGLPDYSFETCQKNLEYGLKLLLMAKKLKCSSILFAGSCWEYSSRSGKLSEDSKTDTLSVFAATKNSLRIIGKSFSAENNIRFYWPRIFYVYGPGQRKTSLIPHIIQSAVNGKIPDLKTPYNRHDFIYVDDVAKAIAAIIEKQPHHSVFNIGSGVSISVKEIVDLTFQYIKNPINPFYGLAEKNDDSQDFWADINRIRRQIGWCPEHDIQSGLQKTIKSFGNVTI